MLQINISELFDFFISDLHNVWYVISDYAHVPTDRSTWWSREWKPTKQPLWLRRQLQSAALLNMMWS